ncbi:MAG: PQQ-binding-like beta-propeller repeat protein [Armatimonadota bacterium]|nr:PQQ-binding-like beta-propeller repeat protein [bacterium]
MRGKFLALLFYIIILAIIQSPVCHAQLAGSPWPCFRHDQLHTGQSTLRGPSSHLVTWTYTLPGQGISSPAVGAERVYTCAGGKLVALTFNGDEIWSFSCGNAGMSSPAVGSDGTVYVASTDGYLYAITSDGQPKWKRSLQGSTDCSPTIGTDGCIYIGGSSKKFFCLRKDGTQKFSYTMGDAVSSSAAIASDGTVYVGCDDGKLYALTSTGTLKWTFSTSPLSTIKSSPCVAADGTIYVASMGGYVYSLRTDGRQVWRTSTGGSIFSSPAIGPDGSIVIGSRNGYLYCISSLGVVKWKYQTGGYVDSSPAVDAAGVAYVGSNDGSVYAVNSDGSLLWSSQIGTAVSSSPAIGNAGSLYVATYDGFLYAFGTDATPPTTPDVIDDGAYSTSQSTLHASWSASDPDSGVVRYEYAIGTAPGGQEILSFTEAGTATEMTRTDLQIPNGATCYISVRATNGAGLVSEVGISDGILVDCTAPSSPIVTDDGTYSRLPNTIHASWTATDSESGLSNYEYAVGTSPGAQDVVSFTSVGLVNEITRTDLALVSGKDYYVTVRVTNNAGLIGQSGVSDGIRVDLTAPSTPVVIDDGAYSSVQGRIHASWTASDAESGISRYEYAIGTSSGAQDVIPFTAIGTSTEVTRTDLTLVSGKDYYVSVRATNGAGLVSVVGTSDGIRTDWTVPTTPVVTDDGAYSTLPNTLHATWSSTDAESGLARYEYAIGTSAGAQDLVPFTSAGLAIEITSSNLALVNGKDYFFSVRSVNRAGLVSAVGVSNGIRVDTTPPTPPVVFDDGEYTGVSDKLHFVFGSGDTESGIERYEYSISTAIGGADVIPWTDSAMVREFTLTGLNLSHNVTYYVNVRAYNHAGLMSEGRSNGIKPDLTSPIMDSISAGGSQSEIKATIKASDPESGVGQVQYVLLTNPSIPANPVWISAQPGQDITITGPFDFKLTYYIAARAANTVGAWGAVVVSNPIRLDETAPTTPVVTDDGAYSTDATTLHASWAASDPESGIDHYSYCVGSAPAAADISAWKDTSLISATLTGLSLTNGGVYYFTVKAINRAGLTSLAGSSDGITIDTTPPAQPVVTDDGDVTYVSDSLHATWTCLESQSGVAEYFYCIGTAPGRNDIVGWTSSGTDALAVVTGLSLKTGVRYYISVKARNNAGLVSTVGSSDGIEYRLGVAVWQKFRCNSSNTGFATASGSATGTLRWKVPTEGYVESSAAIGRDGTSYVGSSDGKLYAISTAGYVRWTYQTGGCIDSSPAIDSFGNIYVGSYDGSLYCIQPSGTLLWKFNAGGMIWSSPTIASDGTVIFGCMDGYVYALTSSGSLKWQYKTGGTVWSSPCLGPDGSISFGCGDGGIYSLTSAGKLKWIYQTGSAADASPAVDKNGVVYVGSGDGTFYAINPDGTRKWQINTGEVCDSSPVIDTNGRVYFGSGIVGWDGAFYCASPDGNVLWKIKTPGAIKSSAAMGADGTMYVGSGDGTLYAINTDSLVLWTRKAEQSILSSPAIGADGSVVFGSDDGCVYCIRDTASIDLTPPTTPSVSLVQDVITPDMALGCSWSASDPESGIQCYYYALGTGSGLDDIVPWTNAGLATSMSLTKLALSPGSCYYVSVKAKNGMSLTSAMGVSKPLSVVLGDIINTVGAAKQRPDGAPIYIQGKVVTAVFDDCIFIEDPNRAAGIRCMVSGCNLTPGAIVNVSGVVGTLYSDKVLNSALVQDTGLRGSVAPLYVTCNFGSRTGLNPSGLLIRTVGRVTQAGAGFFVISDGSVVASPRGVAGVEVRAQNLVAPASGTVISATGVASMDIVDGKPVPVIRATQPPEFVEINETR